MAKNNSANTNIAHINSIEGLAFEMNRHIEALTPATAELWAIVDALRKGLAIWQANELKEARTALE